MDFLGAMFKGIGDTFTAGANVNLGQMNERNVKRQIALGEETLRTNEELAKLNLVADLESQKIKKQALIVAGLLCLLIIILTFR